MARPDDVGFGRRIELSWMRKALELRLDGKDDEETEAAVRRLVDPNNPSRDTARKCWVNVSRTWVRPPNWADGLVDQAMAIYRERPTSDTFFVLNWGMAISAYPFVGSVAHLV